MAFSYETKIDKARKDGGGNVRAYIWQKNDADGWIGPTVNDGYTGVHYRRGTITLARDDAATAGNSSDGNPATKFGFGIYHHPSSNDTGVSYARKMQIEAKDHSTPFVVGTCQAEVMDESGNGNNATLTNTTPE